MDVARIVKTARRRAGLSQRALADASDMAQPAIARIEAGRVVPRVDTLDRLLSACGRRLEAVVSPGAGIDRSAIRQLLQLTPAQRLTLAVSEARNLDLITT